MTPEEAQAIRDTLQRPPAQYSADWVDVVEFPLKVIGWPLDLVLVRFPGWLAGQLTAPRPPSSIMRAYRAMSAWGLRPTIRSTIGPRSAAAVADIVTRGETVYGVNTGFGQLARVRISDDELVKLQENLVRSHSIGVGDDLDNDVGEATNLAAKHPQHVERLDGLIEAFLTEVFALDFVMAGESRG